MLLVAALFGHVPMYRRDARHAAVHVEDRRSIDADRNETTVLVPPHCLEHDRRALDGPGVEVCLLVVQIVRTDDPERMPDHLVGGEAVQALRALVPGLDRQIGSDRKNRIR